jgi:hypothetical protein
MTGAVVAETLPSVGFVVSARSNPRLLGATLRSIELLTGRPDLVLVVAPKGREHLIDRKRLDESPLRMRFLSSDGPEDAWLTTGLRFAAPLVDLLIFVSEGTVFEPEYLSETQRQFSTWEDFVGSIEFVSSAIKLDAGADVQDYAGIMQRREGRLHSLLRCSLRAYSLMPCVLAVRTEACNKLKFVNFSAFCDWMSYALFLDGLRRRGRTAVGFGRLLAEMRFEAERRSGFDFGYTIYNRISRINDYVAPTASRRASYLHPRREKAKMLGEQALQYLLSPGRKRYIATILQGMLAARRDLKASIRGVQRDIRALS